MLQLLRQRFGAAFVEALLKCPTLVKDVEELERAGITIRRVGGHCQAYSIRTKKLICIGSACALSYQLISIAHEKVHVLVSPTPNPTPRVTGRKAFIEMCLEAETDSIVHEVKVAAELIAAGYTVDDHSLSWLKRYKRGGRKAIRKAIENSYASTTGEKYPEYYGGWYDEVVKPKDRLPVFSSGEKGERARSSSLDVSSILSGALAAQLTTLPEGKDGKVLCARFCCQKKCDSCSTPGRARPRIILD